VANDQREMIAAQRKAVIAVRELKLGHRDAGQLLGVSFQRIHQLERTPKMARASINRESRVGRARGLAKRASKKR